jgi:hypothetical protein
MIVRVQDCQEMGYCMRRVRPWFVTHGLDFVDFVRNGIEENDLLATDDEFARNIVAHVHRRESANG